MSACLPLAFTEAPTQVDLGPNWRRAVFNKVDVTGNVVADSKGTPQKFTFIENLHTGDLHLNDMGKDIMFKSYAMFFALPFYTLGMIATAHIQAGVAIYNMTLKFFQDIKQGFTELSPTKFITAPIGVLTDAALATAQLVWRVVRAPIFAICAALACIYMMFSPLDGRELYASIEAKWHDNATYRDVICYKNPYCQEKSNEVTWEGWKHNWNLFLGGRVLFLAPCMQKRGNIDEKIQTSQGVKNHFVRA